MEVHIERPRTDVEVAEQSGLHPGRGVHGQGRCGRALGAPALGSCAHAKCRQGAAQCSVLGRIVPLLALLLIPVQEGLAVGHGLSTPHVVVQDVLGAARRPNQGLDPRHSLLYCLEPHPRMMCASSGGARALSACSPCCPCSGARVARQRGGRKADLEAEEARGRGDVVVLGIPVVDAVDAVAQLRQCLGPQHQKLLALRTKARNAAVSQTGRRERPQTDGSVDVGEARGEEGHWPCSRARTLR